MHELGAGLGYEPPRLTSVFPNETSAIARLLTDPSPGPSAGDYHDAGGFFAGFIPAHVLFSLETLAAGVVCMCLIALAARALGGIAATILIPFAVLAVVVVGSSIAYAIDHAIVVPAIGWVLKIATVSALPIGLGAVAFILEKGHLALSFMESGKKLIGKE